MNIVDVKGKTSYQAVTELQNAINIFEPGNFGILSNDNLVLRNIEKFLTKKEIKFKTERKSKNIHLTTFETTKYSLDNNKLMENEKIDEIVEVKQSELLLNSNLEKYLYVDFQLSTGFQQSLNKLHLRSILNEILISKIKIKGIILINESVKIISTNNEFYPLVEEINKNNIKIIADEHSIAFYSVSQAKNIKINIKSTSFIFKMLCNSNLHIVKI